MFHRFVTSFKHLLASKFEQMSQFINTWRAFWAHMAPTWTPELAQVAIPLQSGIEIAETHFSRQSLEKHRLQAQRRCPNRLQGVEAKIKVDQGAPKGTHRPPHALKTMLLCRSGTIFTKWLCMDVTTPTQQHSFYKKRRVGGTRTNALATGQNTRFPQTL